MNEAERIGIAELRERLAKGLRLADILSCDVPITASARRELDEAKAALPTLLDRIEKLQAGLRDAIVLIDELNKQAPSRQFWGIGQSLHAKIATVRATLARALLTKENRILSETPHAE